MEFIGLLYDVLKCAKHVNKGEYCILDYLNYGNLPDGMRAARDQRGLYLCKCIDKEIGMTTRMLEGRVQPMYNLTTHKKANTMQQVYVGPQTELTEKKIAGLGTHSGAPVYENVFGYDDASVYALIEESKRKEREEATKKT